jgi:hypothetical protein
VRCQSFENLPCQKKDLTAAFGQQSDSVSVFSLAMRPWEAGFAALHIKMAFIACMGNRLWVKMLVLINKMRSDLCVHRMDMPDNNRFINVCHIDGLWIKK